MSIGMMADAIPEPVARHAIRRERRETRRRQLVVASVERLTPVMQRVHLVGDLADFLSLAPDDHVKLFLPVGDEVVMRDYTPRAFDGRELTIDFALHQAGPASEWARAARPGDTLEIGGPRGSRVVADDFDWYLLVGDETALPAITRRIEELRPGVPVASFVVVNGVADAQDVSTEAAWTPRWVERDGRRDDATLLRGALASHRLPAGDGYVWIGAEAAVARALRAELVEARGHRKDWLTASGYWVRGAAGAHETL